MQPNAKLLTRNGELVHEFIMPLFQLIPEIAVWGNRFFVLREPFNQKFSKPAEAIYYEAYPWHIECSPKSSMQHQEGGSHYKDMAIQPVEFIHKNGLGFIEGCVVKYVSRWRRKNGVADLRKARHFLDLLIEMEEGKEQP